MSPRNLEKQATDESVTGRQVRVNQSVGKSFNKIIKPSVNVRYRRNYRLQMLPGHQFKIAESRTESLPGQFIQVQLVQGVQHSVWNLIMTKSVEIVDPHVAKDASLS